MKFLAILEVPFERMKLSFSLCLCLLFAALVFHVNANISSSGSTDHSGVVGCGQVHAKVFGAWQNVLEEKTPEYMASTTENAGNKTVIVAPKQSTVATTPPATAEYIPDESAPGISVQSTGLQVSENELQDEIASDLNALIEVESGFMRALKLLHKYSVTKGDRKGDKDLTDAIDIDGTPLLCFFAVFSTPFGFERRQAVRDGLFQEKILQPGRWGRKAKGHARFFIGLPSLEVVKTEVGQQQVETLVKEMDLHKDIVMIRKQDVYRGSGFKHRYIYEYANYPFQLSKFVMKIDDDVYCKTSFLEAHLEKILLQSASLYYYMGAIMANARPHRNPESKYYLSVEEYPREVHPIFASGTGNILSTELTALLLQEDMYYYAMEDISVAIWLENLIKGNKTERPIKFESLPGWYIFGLPSHVKDPNFVHSLSPTQMVCFYEYNRKGIADKQPCNQLT